MPTVGTIASPPFFFAGTPAFPRWDMPASRLVGYVCSLDRIHIDDLDKENIGIPSTNLDGGTKFCPESIVFKWAFFSNPYKWPKINGFHCFFLTPKSEFIGPDRG